MEEDCKSAATRKQTPGKPNSQTNRKQTNNRMKRKNERQTTGVEVEGIINAYEKIPKRQTNCKFSVAFPQNVTEIIRCRQRSKVCSTKAGAVRLGLPFATPSKPYTNPSSTWSWWLSVSDGAHEQIEGRPCSSPGQRLRLGSKARWLGPSTPPRPTTHEPPSPVPPRRSFHDFPARMTSWNVDGSLTLSASVYVPCAMGALRENWVSLLARIIS